MEEKRWDEPTVGATKRFQLQGSANERGAVAINKSIPYNEWHQLKREDFTPIVESFKQLLECLHCLGLLNLPFIRRYIYR